MAQIDLGKIKFKWQGAYNGATAYVVDDVVESSGSSYICIAATTGNAPPNATYWEQMSQKGTDADLLSISGTVQGDIYYNNGSAIARLGAGTSGDFLKTQGTGANPVWASAGGGLQSQQVFTSTGSSTWTKPAGITKVKVIVTGAGGGGGGGQSTGNGGAGGGAGGTAIEIIDVSSVSTVAVTVGTGGSGGAGGGSGGAGGTSSFGSYCSATGGYGGQTGNQNNNPASTYTRGVGSGGDINLTGGDGMQSSGGSQDDEPAGSHGGASYWGDGGMSGSPNGLYDGGTGKAYGSGGGGGDHSATHGEASGGAGKAGIVVVEEYK